MLFGNQFFNQIRPLNQADAVPIKIILITNLIHFFYITDPVYVKMIKRKASFFILLHNRERRAVHMLGDAQSLCEALGKYGLAHAQVAGQGVDGSGKGFPAQLFTKSSGVCF